MMATCAELQAMLDAANAAYHNIQLTGAVQSIRSGEKQVIFGPSSINNLQRYIAQLQARVDACKGRPGRRIQRFMPIDG